MRRHRSHCLLFLPVLALSVAGCGQSAQDEYQTAQANLRTEQVKLRALEEAQASSFHEVLRLEFQDFVGHDIPVGPTGDWNDQLSPADRQSLDEYMGRLQDTNSPECKRFEQREGNTPESQDRAKQATRVRAAEKRVEVLEKNRTN